MGGSGLVLTLVAVLAIGTGVMVFKQHVEADRQRLVELRHELADAHAATARLRAELAFHRRPGYLLPLAASLGLAPAMPRQLTTIEGVPERPAPVMAGAPSPHPVALPSGARIWLALRPAQGSRP